MPKGELQGPFVFMVSPGYLNAIGMRLIEGPRHDWADGAKSQNVVIINETIARGCGRARTRSDESREVNGGRARVIGVIADVHESSAEDNSGWQMYLPATQFGPDGAQLVVRTKLPPDSGFERDAYVAEINPGQPATEFRPFRGWWIMQFRHGAFLCCWSISLRLWDCCSLRWASMASSRIRSPGGPRRLGSVWRWALRDRGYSLGVIRKTLRLALIGMLAGIAASFIVAQTIATLLFGTAPTDPVTFAATILILMAVAFLAGYIPARRASRINPMVALRNN